MVEKLRDVTAQGHKDGAPKKEHMGDLSQVTQSDRGSCCLVGPRGQEGLSFPPVRPPCPPPWQAHTCWGPSTFLMSHVRVRQMLLIPVQTRLPHLPSPKPALGSTAAAGAWAPWSARVLSGLSGDTSLRSL